MTYVDDSFFAKDRWDKAEILLKPLGAILAAMIAAILGFKASAIFEQRQLEAAENHQQIELMKAREEIQNRNQRQVVDAIMSAFLVPEAKSLDGQSTSETDRADLKELENLVMQLDLIASIFHDSFDVGPLFRHVHRRLVALCGEPALCAETGPLRDQLDNLSESIHRQQLAALASQGERLSGSVFFEDLQGDQSLDSGVEDQPLRGEDEVEENDNRNVVIHQIIDIPAGNTSTQRLVHLEVAGVDRDAKEIELIVSISEPNPALAPKLDPSTMPNRLLGDGNLPNGEVPAVKWEVSAHDLNVSHYDFPFVHREELPDGTEIMISLTQFQEHLACELNLVYLFDHPTRNPV
ncbi:MAG: hypothetical protein AAF604_15330 [Acidobacteriota bacterium]